MVRMSRKDKNKPRGRTSSYAFFVQDCRRNAGATVNFTQFSKACAQEWNSLSPNEKRQYEDMAKRDKVRYDREMKGYVPPPGLIRKKRMKDPNAPKRPASAFILFSAEHRPRIMRSSPSLPITEIARQLGKMWNSQGPREKAPFESKAGQMRQRYDVQMRAYRARGGPKRFKAAVRKSARERPVAKKAGKRKVGRRRKAGRRKAPKRRAVRRRRASSKRRAPKRRAGRKSRSRSGSRGRR